jgi:hypothetical protein
MSLAASTSSSVKMILEKGSLSGRFAAARELALEHELP